MVTQESYEQRSVEIDLSGYKQAVLIRTTNKGRFEEHHIDPLEHSIFYVDVPWVGDMDSGEPMRVEIIDEMTGDVQRIYLPHRIQPLQ